MPKLMFGPKVIKKDIAMRVVFFYPGEEGTFIDRPWVTLYENGIVHIKGKHEETTVHLQNCEILWRFDADAIDALSAKNKVRLLKPKPTFGETSLPENPDPLRP